MEARTMRRKACCLGFLGNGEAQPKICANCNVLSTESLTLEVSRFSLQRDCPRSGYGPGSQSVRAQALVGADAR